MQNEHKTKKLKYQFQFKKPKKSITTRLYGRKNTIYCQKSVSHKILSQAQKS